MRRSEMRMWAYLVMGLFTLLGAGFKGILSHKKSVRCPQGYERTGLARVCILDKCTQCKVSHIFVPRDDARSVLIGLIDDEGEKILFAIFKLTDSDVSKALLRAKERGVKIEMVVDSGGLDTRTNQVLKLQSEGIPVYVFPHPDLELGSRFAIMHNKFFVFYSSGIAGGPLVWTGSFNVTKAASMYNRENVLIIQSRQLADDYAAEFEQLKRESHRL